MVIGTGYMGSCKSNYHMIMTTPTLSDIVVCRLYCACTKESTSPFDPGEYDDCIERATILARK